MSSFPKAALGQWITLGGIIVPPAPTQPPPSPPPDEPKTSYAEHVYNPNEFRDLIRYACLMVERAQRVFGVEGLAFRGSSGCALAFPIGAITGIPLLHVRKNDGNHSGMTWEGARVKRYAFVDDFISGGATLRAVMRSLPSGSRLVCALLGKHHHICHGVQCAWPWDELPIRPLRPEPAKPCWRADGLGTYGGERSTCMQCDQGRWRDDEV